MRAAAIEADTRRAGIIVEMFESARPEDYDNLLAVLDDGPEVALAKLQQKYFLLRFMKSTQLGLDWQQIVKFIQRAIRLNEEHKKQRTLKT